MKRFFLLVMMIILMAPQVWAQDHGTISGTVYGETSEGDILSPFDGEQPLPFAHVIAFRVGMEEPIADAGTDELGNYVLEVPYGEYHVRAGAEGYIPEWYDNAQHREEATVLVVNQEHNPDGIVFLLAPHEHEFGTISGTIFGETPDGEQPLPFAHVIAFRVGMEEPIADAGTDDLGNYVLEVPYGEYHVRAGAEGYIPEWYDNAQHREGATVLVVNQEHNPDGIVFLLAPHEHEFGTISGTIFGETPDGEQPLPFAHVIAFRVGMEEPIADAGTDDLGNYVLEVPYGEYHVRAGAEGYIPEWYDNAQHRGEATVLVVNQESNPDGIVFLLAPHEPQFGTISGTIFGETPDGEQPLPFAHVIAFRVGMEEPIADAGTDELGNYVLEVPYGEYHVRAGAEGYIPEWYDNAQHRDEATVLVVNQEHNPDGIVFLLAPHEHEFGTISGTIFGETPDGEQPLPFAHVIAFRVGMEEPVADAATDELDNYVLEVPYGEYHVRAGAEGYIPEWYDNAQHRGEATVLVVNQEHNPDGIVFLLAPHENEFGTISGTIFGETPDGEQPLPFAHVIAFRVGMEEPIADAGTDELGNYVLELPYGEYHVRAGAEGYIPEWYDNAPNRDEATVLVVNQEHNPDGIVFLLAPHENDFGIISGTIFGETPDGEQPLPFAHVIAFRVGMEEPIADAGTDELGNYVLEVPYGEYHVRAGAEGYIPEWYDNAPNRDEATVLVVNQEYNPDGIVFLLAPHENDFGTISGTIFGETPDGEQPLPFAHVIAFRVGMEEPIADAGTDELGNYVLEVPYGEYHVRAGAEGYIPEWYDNAPNRDEATVLVVNQEHNPDGIVFLLAPHEHEFGTISGTIFGETPDGEQPLPFAHVIAYRVGMEEPIADAGTDELGNYVLELPYGEYHVRAGAEGYIPEWYDNAQHREEATVLVVNEESNPDGIIFVLTPLTTAINQNYPNPFNIHTMVSFTLAKPGDVELIVYNIYGQRVTTLADGFYQAGIHEIIWDGRNVNGNLVASGVYYYRLKVGDKSETRRMTLLK